MKKILSIFIVLSVFAIGVKAQTAPDASVQNKNEIKKGEKKQMMKDLQLTKQQRKEIKQFRKPLKQQRDAIQNDGSLTQQQKQQKLKELRMEQLQKLNAVLTPEQKEKLKAEAKENHPRRGVTNMPNERTSQ